MGAILWMQNSQKNLNKFHTAPRLSLDNSKTDDLPLNVRREQRATFASSLSIWKEDIFASGPQGRFWLERIQLSSSCIVLSNGRMLSHSLSLSLSLSLSVRPSLFHSKIISSLSPFEYVLCKPKQSKTVLSSHETPGQRKKKQGNASRPDPRCLDNRAKYWSHSNNGSERTAGLNNLIYPLSHQGSTSASLWILLAVTFNVNNMTASC